MLATEDLLVIGCADCDIGGQIKFYDRENLNLLHIINGSRTKHLTGASLTQTTDINDLVHLWYTTSDMAGTLELHSVYLS